MELLQVAVLRGRVEQVGGHQDGGDEPAPGAPEGEQVDRHGGGGQQARLQDE
jgi:hypothetical protein